MQLHRRAVVAHLAKAGRALELHQVERAGPLRGNVSPWTSREVEDFHSTLMAIWVWAKHQALSGEKRFEDNRALAWRFVLEASIRFLPPTLGPQDESPFDASCLLLSALADVEAGTEDSRQAMADLAADALRTYITTGEAAAVGRQFHDPGFQVWALALHARATGNDRALKATVSYTDHFFGTEAPPAPAEESQEQGAIFDFLSTTATRVLATIAAQGEIPFIGLWLRNRVLPVLPSSFTPRTLDENTWNATIAWMLGKSYSMTHDQAYLKRYSAIMRQLSERDADGDGALGRDPTFAENEVLATWAWAMAMDALK